MNRNGVILGLIVLFLLILVIGTGLALTGP